MEKYIIYYESDWTNYAIIINGTIDDVYYFIGKEILTNNFHARHFRYEIIKSKKTENKKVTFLEQKGYTKAKTTPISYYRTKQTEFLL